MAKSPEKKLGRKTNKPIAVLDEELLKAAESQSSELADVASDHVQTNGSKQPAAVQTALKRGAASEPPATKKKQKSTLGYDTVTDSESSSSSESGDTSESGSSSDSSASEWAHRLKKARKCRRKGFINRRKSWFK